MWNKRFALGLEITDFAAKAAEITVRSKSRAAINRHAAERLPDNSIRDGRILRKDEVVDALRNLVKQIRPRTRKAHIALPGSSVMIRFLKLPDLPDKKLRKVIEFELEHRIPLPFDSPQFDFVKLGSPAPAGGDALRDVMLVAAPLETIREYAEVVALAGLAVKSIEIRPLSLLRLIERTGQAEPGKTVLLADVGDRMSDLGMIHNGELRVARSIPIAFPDPESGDSAALRRACGELVREIERLLIFFRYNLRFRDRSIDRILLSGEVPYLERIMLELAGSTNLNAEISLVSGEAFRMRTIEAEQAFLSLAVPIGLALRGIGP